MDFKTVFFSFWARLNTQRATVTPQAYSDSYPSTRVLLWRFRLVFPLLAARLTLQFRSGRKDKRKLLRACVARICRGKQNQTERRLREAITCNAIVVQGIFRFLTFFLRFPLFLYPTSNLVFSVSVGWCGESKRKISGKYNKLGRS